MAKQGKNRSETRKERPERHSEKRQKGAPAVREYKNRLFIRLFQEPKELLALYNAVNDSHYTDASRLVVNTLEDVLYLGMKNDVSFLIGSEMNLYETQSTWNPNMPLRGLFYFSRLYKGYVAVHGLDIYSSVHHKLPTPRYIIFYNGTRDEAERMELKLSDSYEVKTGSFGLECTATVLNINFGHNQKLMENCHRLYEYAYLVSMVRCHLKEGLTLKNAIDLAIDDCLKEGILEEFLTKHREEATMDLMTELYSVERHDRIVRKEAMEEGREKGREEGRKEGRKEGRAETLISMIVRKLSRGKTPEMISEELEEEPALVQAVCDAAQSFAPEYDSAEICQAMKKAGTYEMLEMTHLSLGS